MLHHLNLLFKTLGYTFKQPVLLERALTHRSYGKHHNERLEFLGDSLLNFCIAEKLFHQYPHYPEGDLSRARANLVNGRVLAALAKNLHVDQHIRLGAGELKSGGLNKKSILADVMEAIIGAIYLDSGIEACHQSISSWFTDEFIQHITRGIEKDPKTILQEYAQAKKIALPVYEILSIKGDEHKQVFTVSCQVPGMDTVKGMGTSRKNAEQDAAQNALKGLS